MFTRIAAATLLALLTSLGSVAHASVISVLNVPSAILEGGSVTLVADISVAGIPAGYVSETITGISYTFNSGDGDSYSNALTGLWTTALSVSTSFTYENAGTYSPTFSATVSTVDGYYQYVNSGYWAANGGQWVCDAWFLFWCTSEHWQTNYVWIDTSGWHYYTTGFTYPTSSGGTLAVNSPNGNLVPLPTSALLVLAAMALLLASRRRTVPLRA